MAILLPTVGDHGLVGQGASNRDSGLAKSPLPQAREGVLSSLQQLWARRSPLWAAGLPLALLVVVATAQFTAVHVGGLTRWKGGGFGMYSEMGHSKRWPLFFTEDGRILSADEVPLWAIRETALWRGERALARVGERLRAVRGEPVIVEIWGLQYDPATRQLSHLPIAQYVPEDVATR